MIWNLGIVFFLFKKKPYRMNKIKEIIKGLILEDIKNFGEIYHITSQIESILKNTEDKKLPSAMKRMTNENYFL